MSYFSPEQTAQMDERVRRLKERQKAEQRAKEIAAKIHNISIDPRISEKYKLEVALSIVYGINYTLKSLRVDSVTDKVKR
jgi:hypothetical protein